MNNSMLPALTRFQTWWSRILEIHDDIDSRWPARDVADIAFAAGYNSVVEDKLRLVKELAEQLADAKGTLDNIRSNLRRVDKSLPTVKEVQDRLAEANDAIKEREAAQAERDEIRRTLNTALDKVRASRDSSRQRERLALEQLEVAQTERAEAKAELASVTSERSLLREAFQVPASVTDPQYIADQWRKQHSSAIYEIGELRRGLDAVKAERDAAQSELAAALRVIEKMKEYNSTVAEPREAKLARAVDRLARRIDCKDCPSSAPHGCPLPDCNEETCVAEKKRWAMEDA